MAVADDDAGANIDADDEDDADEDDAGANIDADDEDDAAVAIYIMI